MSSIFNNKITKTKKLDKHSVMRLSKNDANGRIFVEFASEDGKLVLQKSFQNNYFGNKEAEEFQDTIKSIGDLKAYFKIKE